MMIWFIAFIIGVVADITSTAIALTRDDLEEANVLLRPFPVASFLMISFTGRVLMGLFIVQAYEYFWWVFMLLFFVLLVITVNNIWHLYRSLNKPAGSSRRLKINPVSETRHG